MHPTADTNILKFLKTRGAAGNAWRYALPTEEALLELPLEGLVIARPSLLVGDREALGQPKRTAERVAAAVGKLLGPLIPAN